MCLWEVVRRVGVCESVLYDVGCVCVCCVTWGCVLCDMWVCLSVLCGYVV